MKIVFCKYSSKDDDFLSSEIDAVFQEEGDRLKRGNLNGNFFAQLFMFFSFSPFLFSHPRGRYYNMMFFFHFFQNISYSKRWTLKVI